MLNCTVLHYTPIRVLVVCRRCLFCCRCGARRLVRFSVFAVVAVPVSLLFLLSLCFPVTITHREAQRQQKNTCRGPQPQQQKKHPRNDSKKRAPQGTKAKKTRPRNNRKKNAPRNDSKKATTAKKNLLPMGTSLFCCCCRGAFFVCCRCGNRGSLTHWLPGSAQREQKQHKATTAKEKHWFPLYAILCMPTYLSIDECTHTYIYT